MVSRCPRRSHSAGPTRDRLFLPRRATISSRMRRTIWFRTVVIAKGGTVIFDLSGPGREIDEVAIYLDGIEPGDVETAGAGARPAAVRRFL